MSCVLYVILSCNFILSLIKKPHSKKIVNLKIEKKLLNFFFQIYLLKYFCLKYKITFLQSIVVLF